MGGCSGKAYRTRESSRNIESSESSSEGGEGLEFIAGGAVDVQQGLAAYEQLYNTTGSSSSNNGQQPTSDQQLLSRSHDTDREEEQLKVRPQPDGNIAGVALRPEESEGKVIAKKKGVSEVGTEGKKVAEQKKEAVGENDDYNKTKKKADNKRTDISSDSSSGVVVGEGENKSNKMDPETLDAFLATADPNYRSGTGGDGSGKPPGSQVYIYKQDPSVEGVGHRTLWIPVEVNAGPRSEDVVVLGMGKTFGATDRSNNFLYDPNSAPDASDAVHTFAVVQRVMNMYRRAIKRMKYRKITHLTWQWGTAPLLVFPHAGHKKNAFYDRSSRTLAFYYFRDQANTRNIYTCRSLDVVAHETGHAILDSLKPSFLDPNGKTETHALHEAFADLTALFAVLDHFDMCEALIARTKGNLHNKSFLPLIAEEFGQALGRSFGMEALRDIADNLRVTDVVAEAHNWSRVFTGAVYDILVRIFESEMDVTRYDPAETLYRTAKHLISVLLLAFLDAPDQNATLRDVALAMMRIEPKQPYKGFMKHEFKRRQVFDDGARPKPWQDGPSLSRCGCGTLDAAKQPKLKESLTEPLRPAINLFVEGRPVSVIMY